MNLSFIDSLIKYKTLSPARFHMPGHKGLVDFPNISDIDITELDFSDDLHKPEGIIKSLEERIANVYSSRRAFLSVNGSTAGILAMLLYLAATGKKRVLIARDCHKSALYGTALSGLSAIGVFPTCGIPAGTVDANTIDVALKKSPCDAVLITSPNYYGMCADTEAIADVAHSHGALLLLDCAHGAHFPFMADEKLRRHQLFADMAVTSLHKTLPAMTQTAALNIYSDKLDCDIMQAVLHTVQTSSPSYPLMASAELALELAAKGDQWHTHTARIARVRGILHALGYKTLSSEIYDTTRLYIFSGSCKMNGFKLQNALINCGIYPEMADSLGVLLITTPLDKDEWYTRLTDALKPLKSDAPVFPDIYDPMQISHNDESYLPVDIRSALFGAKIRLPLASCEGRIAAEPIGLYPPGISAVFPGETLTAPIIKALLDAVARGGQLMGTDCVYVVQ